MNVVSIKTQADGTKIREINPSSTDTLAQADFHDKMKRGISDSNIKAIVCLMIDDEGAVHKYDKWSEEPVQTPAE